MSIIGRGTGPARRPQLVFPEKRLVLRMQPFRGPTQAQLFGDRAKKEGDVDIVLFSR
jgi:hypothetical protein